MQHTANGYQALWRQCRESTTVEEVRRVLDQVDALAQTADLSSRDVLEVKAEAFESLRELTVGDPDTGGSVIDELLLPACLMRTPDASEEVNVIISRSRAILVKWLDQYSALDRTRLRSRVLDRSSVALQSDDPRGACKTIAHIGFRRDDIVKTLWKVTESHAGEAGDIALSTLASLGVIDSDRDDLVAGLHRRAVLRCNPPLVGSIRRLADPRSIDVAVRNWLNPEGMQVLRWLRHVALRIPIDVADAKEQDSDLQDEVWRLVSELCTEHPDLYSSDLRFGSDIAPRCNSPAVVPSLLQWLAKSDREPEHAAHRRYLVCLRLGECVRPRQLRGWENVDGPAAASLLSQDATLDTQHRGYAPDWRMQRKRMAWRTLLTLGCADVLNWFGESVASETNPYLRQSIEKLLACFRIDPLPPTVLQWITEPFDMKLHPDSGEWAPTFGAIEMARSAASRQAFEALLNFGLTHDGKPLKRSVDALAEVAEVLAAAGDTSVVDSLLQVAAHDLHPHHRTAAVGALEFIAARGLLSDARFPELAAMAFEEDREPFEAGLIVSTLGRLEGGFTPSMVARLRSWARDRDDWLGGRSLEALARHGLLVQDPTLLFERLGLREAEGRWDWEAGRAPLEWAPFVIGLLYLNEPASLLPAIATILRTADWRGAVQMIHVLNSAHGNHAQVALPTELVSALLGRARQRQTQTSHEKGVFAVLAHLAPDAMACEPWDETWSRWLPDARASLADGLGEARYTQPVAEDRAVSLLLSLTQDGQYAVRRSAYRALTRQSPSSLLAACEAWSKSPLFELRRRAAEAWGWLATGTHQADRASKLHRLLSSDRERAVRDSAEQARRDARERRWAKEYLSRVSEVKDGSNESLLSVWRYGEALVQVGDDASLKSLRAYLNAPGLSPNVRQWLQQMVKGIDDRWRKVTRRWPDPWLPWEGAVEECEGTLTVPKGSPFQVHYSLWLQPAPTPSQIESWGGAGWPVDPWRMHGISNLALQLADGRQGEATITTLSGDMVVFVGEGPYPEQLHQQSAEDSPKPEA